MASFDKLKRYLEEDETTAEDLAAQGWEPVVDRAGEHLKDEWNQSGELIHRAAQGDRDALSELAMQSALSTVGAVKGPKVKSLAMDEASRMARAKEMGFDTGKTFYHGTKANIEGFDPEALGSSTKAGSGNLSAGVGGAAIGAGLLAGSNNAEASDMNGLDDGPDDWEDVPLEANAQDGGPDDWEDVPLEPSWGEKALGAIGAAGRFIDSYGGDASARAGIMAGLKGEPVGKAALEAYGNSEKAPSGKDIALEMGASDEPLPSWVTAPGRMWRDSSLTGKIYKGAVPYNIRQMIEGASAADVGGLGIEMAASPLAVAGPALRGVGKTAEFVNQSVKNSILGRLAAKGAGKVGGLAAKTGELVTGVPRREIETYWNRAPEVEKLMAESGWSVPAAADTMRDNWTDALRKKKYQQNEAIETALDAAETRPEISIKPITETLEKGRDKLDDIFQSGEKADLEKVINKVKEASVPEYFKEAIPNALRSNPSVAYSKKILNMVEELTGKEARDQLTTRSKNLLQFLRETLEGKAAQVMDNPYKGAAEAAKEGETISPFFKKNYGLIKNRSGDIENAFNRINELKAKNPKASFKDLFTEALKDDKKGMAQRLIDKQMIKYADEIEKVFNEISASKAGNPDAAFSDILEKVINEPYHATRGADPAYQAQNFENFARKQEELSGKPRQTHKERLQDILKKASSDKEYAKSSAINDAQGVIADQSLESLKKLQEWAAEITDNPALNKIKELEERKTNLRYLNMIKGYLQNRAKPSYMENGQVFQTAPAAANISKKGAAVAREILNKESPEIARANELLSQLHGIEENTPKRLMTSEKPEAGILAAGSGVNERNRMMLKEAGDLAGEDFLGDAELLSAGKRFQNAKWEPVDPTGKAISRKIYGGSLGAATALALGLDPKIGAFTGAALTSPAALKLAMDAGHVVQKIPGAVEKLQKVPQKPMNRAFIASRIARNQGLANQMERSDQKEGNELLAQERRNPLSKHPIVKAIMSNQVDPETGAMLLESNFGQYAPIILEAIQKGPKELDITGYVLRNSPEYRKLIER
jgi:hypothetical protein